MKIIGSARIETLAEAGYEISQTHTSRDGVVLRDDTGKLELWQTRSTPCAGYCLQYGPDIYLEFARTFAP